MKWNETHRTVCGTVNGAENYKGAASSLVSALRRLRSGVVWAIMPCGLCIIQFI